MPVAVCFENSYLFQIIKTSFSVYCLIVNGYTDWKEDTC